jgi:hypothetical protein
MITHDPLHRKVYDRLLTAQKQGQKIARKNNGEFMELSLMLISVAGNKQ